MYILNKQEVCEVSGGLASAWVQARDAGEATLITDFVNWGVGEIEKGAEAVWGWIKSIF